MRTTDNLDSKVNTTATGPVDVKSTAVVFQEKLRKSCPDMKITATTAQITQLFQGLIERSNEADEALAAHIPPAADQQHVDAQAAPIQIIQDFLRPSLNKTCERLLDQITWLYGGERTRYILTLSLGIDQLSCLVGVLPSQGFDFSALQMKCGTQAITTGFCQVRPYKA